MCEIKRLFVRPQHRGLGIAKALAKAVIEQGKLKGFASIRLNTNHRMPTAIGLYRTLGFKDIAPYEHFEVDGMVYLELSLR
jgi:ribosomal protein S18 acetylase RimI-like enzyme